MFQRRLLAMVLLCLSPIAAAAQAPAPTDTLFVFHLAADQLVPPATSDNTGGCFAWFDAGASELEILCTHSVSAATTIEIREAPPGANGAVVRNLGAAASPVFHTWSGLTPAEVASLLAGNYYVLLSTAGGPALRGQMLSRTVDTVSFSMSATQAVPASGSSATGSCTADLDNSATAIAVACTHNVPSPTAVHVHRGVAGQNGVTVFTFPSAASPLNANVPLTPTEVASFAGSLLYLDVHSFDFPAGEIRGRIGSAPAPPPPPGFSKAFAPSSIAVNAVSRLTFTIANTSSSTASNLTFSDAFPAGMAVAPAPNVSNSCGGTFSAAAGATTVSLSGGTVSASTACTLAVDLTSSVAGTRTNTSGALTSTHGNSGTATANLVVTSVTTFSVASATGSGTISGSISGGGTSCTIASAAATTPAALGTTAPGGIDFPHGLIDFRLTGCTPSAAVTFTLTLPSPMPPGSQYWKYGPTSSSPAASWYTVPATISGTSVSYTITDGGPGDDDLTANGVIEDPGGPATATPVPIMPWPALAALALLLFAIAVRSVGRS